MSYTLLKETAGDSLVGDVDGNNTDFQVSYSFDADSVQVYHNGVLLVRDWDDGFWTISPDIVRMKEAPRLGDSLEIEYRADITTGGGAEGGRPDAPTMKIMEPGMLAGQNLPELGANDVKPETDAPGAISSRVLADSLRPVIIRPDGGEDPCQ